MNDADKIAELTAQKDGLEFALKQATYTRDCQATIIARMTAESSQPILSAVVASEFDLAKALRKAYNFGQTYWQQADSEYASQNKKSDETAAKFAAFVEESVAALASAPAARPTAEKAGDLSNSRIIEIAYENGMKVRTGQGAIKFARAILASMSADAQSKGGA